MKKTMIIIAVTLFFLVQMVHAETFDTTVSLITAQGSGTAIDLIAPQNEVYSSGDEIELRYLVSYATEETLSCDLMIGGVLYHTMTVTDGQDKTENKVFEIPQGKKEWEVVCTVAGETTESSKEEFTIDIDEPFIILNIPDPYVSYEDTIGVSFTVQDNLASTLDCNTSIIHNELETEIGLGQINPSTDLTQIPEGSDVTLTITDLDHGNYTWTVGCFDEASNYRSSIMKTFTINLNEVFSVTTNKQKYNLGEAGVMIISAPFGAEVTLLITNPLHETEIETYDGNFPVISTLDSATLSGTYSIEAFMTHLGTVTNTTTSYTVDNSLSAEIGADNTTIAVGESIEFTALGSGGVGTLSYEWNFDDEGETASGDVVSHKFDEVGTYTVEVTITDESGNTAKDTVAVEVVTRYPIKFIVQDSAKKGIGGALVYLNTEEVTTNNAGEALFNVYKGTYDLTIFATEYKAFTESAFRVTGNRTQEITLQRLEELPLVENSTSEESLLQEEVTVPETKQVTETPIPEIKSETVKKIDAALRDMKYLKGENKKIAEYLGIEAKLKSAKTSASNIEKAIAKAASQPGMTDEEREQKLKSFEEDLKKLEASTIKSTRVIQTSTVTTKQTLESIGNITEQFASMKKVEFSKRSKKAYLKEVQNYIEDVESKVHNVDIQYLGENSNRISVVENAHGINNHTYVVHIPETVSTLEGIQALTAEGATKADRIVMFDLKTKNNTAFAVSGTITEEQVGKIVGAILPSPKPFDKGNQVTGFSVMNAEGGVSWLGWLLILVILGGLGFGTVRFNLHKKIPSFKSTPLTPELQILKTMMDDCKKHVEGKDSEKGNECYQKIMQHYAKLAPAEKTRVHAKIMELHARLLVMQVRKGLKEADALIALGKKEEAHKHYAEIQGWYKEIPQQYKHHVTGECHALVKKLT